MGQLLHGSARTTEAVRRAIQDSQERIARLAKHYNLNPKTAATWKQGDFVPERTDGAETAALHPVIAQRGGLHRDLPAASKVASLRCCLWLTACLPCKPLLPI